MAWNIVAETANSHETALDGDSEPNNVWLRNVGDEGSYLMMEESGQLSLAPGDVDRNKCELANNSVCKTVDLSTRL